MSNDLPRTVLQPLENLFAQHNGWAGGLASEVHTKYEAALAFIDQQVDFWRGQGKTLHEYVEGRKEQLGMISEIVELEEMLRKGTTDQTKEGELIRSIEAELAEGQLSKLA